MADLNHLFLKTVSHYMTKYIIRQLSNQTDSGRKNIHAFQHLCVAWKSFSFQYHHHTSLSSWVSNGDPSKEIFLFMNMKKSHKWNKARRTNSPTLVFVFWTRTGLLEVMWRKVHCDFQYIICCYQSKPTLLYAHFIKSVTVLQNVAFSRDAPFTGNEWYYCKLFKC